MRILGLSALYHDSAAALIEDAKRLFDAPEDLEAGDAAVGTTSMTLEDSFGA